MMIAENMIPALPIRKALIRDWLLGIAVVVGFYLFRYADDVWSLEDTLILGTSLVFITTLVGYLAYRERKQIHASLLSKLKSDDIVGFRWNDPANTFEAAIELLINDAEYRRLCDERGLTESYIKQPRGYVMRLASKAGLWSKTYDISMRNKLFLDDFCGAEVVVNDVSVEQSTYKVMYKTTPRHDTHAAVWATQIRSLIDKASPVIDGNPRWILLLEAIEILKDPELRDQSFQQVPVAGFLRADSYVFEKYIGGHSSSSPTSLRHHVGLSSDQSALEVNGNRIDIDWSQINSPYAMATAVADAVGKTEPEEFYAERGRVFGQGQINPK